MKTYEVDFGYFRMSMNFKFFTKLANSKPLMKNREIKIVKDRSTHKPQISRL